MTALKVRAAVQAAAAKHPGEFLTLLDVSAECPGIPRNLVRVWLKDAHDAGEVTVIDDPVTGLTVRWDGE